MTALPIVDVLMASAMAAILHGEGVLLLWGFFGLPLLVAFAFLFAPRRRMADKALISGAIVGGGILSTVLFLSDPTSGNLLELLRLVLRGFAIPLLAGVGAAMLVSLRNRRRRSRGPGPDDWFLQPNSRSAYPLVHVDQGLALTLDDLAAIRAALQAAGLSSEKASEFTGSQLHAGLSAWENFVDTDWSTWDPSEYEHDIVCRAWIQVAIDHSCAATAAKITEAARAADETFKRQMVRARDVVSTSWRVPMLRGPYFWQTHVIHPELADGPPPRSST